MNETLNSLYTRRSIRKFKPEQITRDELDAVLKAGKYAPTGRDSQQPVIVAVQDEQTRKRVSELNGQVAGRTADQYYGAPTIIIVFAGSRTYDRDISVMDCAAATENMLIAAHSMGLGACWVNRPMKMFETEQGRQLLKEWNLPDIAFGVSSIALGYPDCENPEPAARKDGYTIII